MKARGNAGSREFNRLRRSNNLVFGCAMNLSPFTHGIPWCRSHALFSISAIPRTNAAIESWAKPRHWVCASGRLADGTTSLQARSEVTNGCHTFRDQRNARCTIAFAVGMLNAPPSERHDEILLLGIDCRRPAGVLSEDCALLRAV